MTNEYKTSGPVTDYIYGTVHCCRTWPVVTATLTWDPRDEIMKREQWWWRTCGLCHEIPRPVEEERP